MTEERISEIKNISKKPSKLRKAKRTKAEITRRREYPRSVVHIMGIQGGEKKRKRKIVEQ